MEKTHHPLTADVVHLRYYGSWGTRDIVTNKKMIRDVSVAFVIRRGRISELLSQLIFSMRSGMFFFDCNSAYVVLTRS